MVLDFAGAIELVNKYVEHTDPNIVDSSSVISIPPNNKYKDVTFRKKELSSAFKVISDYFSITITPSNATLVSQNLTNALQALLHACGDDIPDIRLAADEHLNTVIKTTIGSSISEKVLIVLFKGTKLSNKLSQKEAFKNFANVARFMKPQKCRTFVTILLPQLKIVFSNPSSIIMPIMPEVLDKTLKILGYHITNKESMDLVTSITPVLSNTIAEIRRNAAQCIAQICKHVPQCPIDEICMNIHEIAHSVLKINKVEKKEVVSCSNLPCLQGCVNTFINLLDVLLGIGNRNVQNSSNYYSQNQIFSNLISDLLTYCLSINDQNILSPSLELLSRLLSQYSSYCSQWRREKVMILLEKLYFLLRHNPLPTVKSYVVEALAKLCEVFTTIFVDSTLSNEVSIEEMIRYLNHSDYFIRGKTSVWIATIIQQCIVNSVDITSIPYVEKISKATSEASLLIEHSYPIAVELLPNTTETAVLAHLYERQTLDSKILEEEEALGRQERTNTQIFTHLLSLLLNKAHVESSSLCLKLICNAFGLCLPVCVHVAELCNLVPIYLFALTRIDDSFWGVKYELLELLEKFDFTLLAYYGGKNNIGHQSTTEALLNVVWKYIVDENERVRQKACETLMQILPNLNLHSTSFSSESIKRTLWNFDYERILLRQIVSKEIHYEPSREIIRDHELLNASIILKNCLEKLKIVANDKHQLVGYLNLLNSIAKQYGSYDEQHFYLINIHKGAVCVQDQSFLSQHTLEVIDHLFDIVKWYEGSTDLTVHATILETLGFYTLQLEYLQESESTLQYVTNTVLNYLLFLLDTMNDLANSKDRTKLPEIDSNQYGIVISRNIFEKLLENIARSLRTTGSSISQDDAISLLLNNLFRTLYFVILFGDQVVVSSRTAKIIQHLQIHIQNFEEYGILCVQELFVTLFGKKSTYFSVNITYQHSPQLVQDLDCELFDKLFIHGKNLQHITQNTRTRSKSSILKTGFNKKNTLIQGGKVGDLTVTQILDLFEPLVLSIKESFKFTHSQKVQSLILFMLSRMVLTGVDFTRLDKDHSFLQHLIKLINDMHLFQSAEEDKFNTLHQIIDFVSILLFTVKYKPEELNQDTLFSAITTGISSSNWTISFILQSLGPLLIRSYTDFIRVNKTGEQESALENPYGEAILALILKHVGFTQCMKVLTLLLKTVVKVDIALWKSLSFIIAQKFFVENKTQVQIDWFRLDEELDVVFLFLESLHLDLKDTTQGHYASALTNLLQELVEKSLQKERELADESSSGDVFTLEANESIILQMLIVMKSFNLQHADTPTTLKLDILSKYLTFCNLGFHFHLNGQLRDVYLEKIVLRMIPECLSLLTSLYNFYYDSTKLEALEPMFTKLLQTLRSIEHSRSKDFHNYSHFNCGLFTCIVSILVYYSNMNDKFEVKVFQFLNSNLKQSVKTHAEAVTKYTHFLAIIHLLTLSKQSESFFAESVNSLNADFWKICYYMSSEAKTKEFFDKLRKIKFSWSTDSLIEFLKEEWNRYLENRMLLRLRYLIEFIGKFPLLPEIKRLILEYQPHITLRVEKHLYHQALSQFKGIQIQHEIIIPQKESSFLQSFQKEMMNHPKIALTSVTRDKLEQIISTHVNSSLLFDSIPSLDVQLVTLVLRRVLNANQTSPYDLLLVANSIRRIGIEWTQNDISQICTFICDNVDHLFIKVSIGTIQMKDVDAMVHLLFCSLLFLKQNKSLVTLEQKEQVLVRACKMLVDASSICQPILLENKISLDSLLKQVIGHIFPISESQNLKLPKKESLLGNQIPFIYPHHLESLYQMHIIIAEMHLNLVFDPYTKEMMRIDLPQLRNLIRMVSTLQLNDSVFQDIWNLAYDLFQGEISVQGYDELQLDSIKLLTILLIKMKFKEETNEPKKSFTAFKLNANKHSVLLPTVNQIRHSDLKKLSDNVEEFLFALEDFKEHNTFKTCVVDTVYGLASFDMCIVSIENAIRSNLNNNVMLAKELIKSICLLLIHNGSVFGEVEGKSTSKHYTVENLFLFFQQLLQENIIKDDYLIKFYVVIGLVKSFCALSPKTRDIHSTFISTTLQEVYSEQISPFSLHLSIVYLLEEKQNALVVKIISALSEKIAQLLKDERRIQHKLILIHMIAYVIQSMPDLSVNGFVKKSIEAMFSIADLGTTPFVVVDYICATFRNLLLSNGLPVLERKLIENTTTMKQTCFVSTKASIQKNHEEKLKADALGSRYSLDVGNAAAFRKQQTTSTNRFMFWKKSTPTTPQPLPPVASMDTTSTQQQPQNGKKKIALTKDEQRRVERLEYKRVQDTKSAVANPISRQTLLLLNTISAMYANFLNASDANIIEMVKEKNKTMTLQLLQDIDSRIAERRDTELIFVLIPQLIGSFFERDQILPMIFGDFLRKDKFSAKAMLSCMLYRYIPELYKKDKKVFEDWVGIALDTISMKKPTHMALWALMCLFVSACSAWDSSQQWIYVEIASFSTKFILQKWDSLHERIFITYLELFIQGIQTECSTAAQQSILQSLKRIFGSELKQSEDSPFMQHICQEVTKRLPNT